MWTDYDTPLFQKKYQKFCSSIINNAKMKRGKERNKRNEGKVRG